MQKQFNPNLFLPFIFTSFTAHKQCLIFFKFVTQTLKTKINHYGLRIHLSQPGGSYKMSFINFSTGNGHSFGGKYIELKLNEFIKYTDAFDDSNLPGEMTTSVRLNKVFCGTELKIIQENIPAVIPTEMCYFGWQESLDKLKKLVEPEIPDGA